ncbi:hypothetical protein [Archangium lansingense]|uniref:Uncharacterized protein n=1 Tax=Archangium lansingense TaxID=2995310 RepID=A0ABT4A6Q4_9BACT|nr:hypothetical protein [Archangium lansinium]MCY1077325.1 hypothetical protein [Archangium lansinium]
MLKHKVSGLQSCLEAGPYWMIGGTRNIGQVRNNRPRNVRIADD